MSSFRNSPNPSRQPWIYRIFAKPASLRTVRTVVLRSVSYLGTFGDKLPRHVSRRMFDVGVATRDAYNNPNSLFLRWRGATGVGYCRGATPRPFFHRIARFLPSSNFSKFSKIILTLSNLFRDLVFQVFGSFSLHFQQHSLPRPAKLEFINSTHILTKTELKSNGNYTNYTRIKDVFCNTSLT